MRRPNGTFAPVLIDPTIRFWRMVNKDGPTVSGMDSPCWVWLGGKIKARFPYGQFWTGKGTMLAHRWSFEHHNGPIPVGLLALHRCDNCPCVNPAHLFLGTMKDNLADMRRKGRDRKPGSPPLPLAWTPLPAIGTNGVSGPSTSPTCAKGHQWGPPRPGRHRCLTCRREAELRRPHRVRA